MWALQSFGEFFFPSRFETVDLAPLATDLLGFVGFGLIALHARRVWPLCATALQLLSLSAHFARWADLALPKLVYALMRGGPTTLAMLVLLAGTLLHMRRMKVLGQDKDWQDWNGASSEQRR